MAHNVSNINTRHRLTQVLILVITIIVFVLASQLANAQRSHKVKYTIKYTKAKHRSSIHKNSDLACYILHKKRTSIPKHPLIASSKHSNNNKSLAETDEPARLKSSN